MDEGEAPTIDELVAANCWFPKTDRTPWADVTAFKQRARLHQAHWREAQGYQMGTHTPPSGVPTDNGSRLLEQEPIEADVRNFLNNPAIHAAVTDRARHRDPRRTANQAPSVPAVVDADVLQPVRPGPR